MAAINFFPGIKHVGFYLDDWVMLNTLARGPQNFFELFNYYFSADPRVVKRPLEALHFMLMFKLFGLKPLGYHVFNLILEVLSAWLLYFCLHRLTRSMPVALVTSILFLIYPSHNSTHYWVVCSSVGMSMILYLGSLLADIEAVLRDKKWLHAVSGILFLASLLNYEVFLPLGAVNVLVVLTLSLRLSNSPIKNSLLCTGALSLAFLIELGYLRFIVPLLAEAWMHNVKLDLSLMLSTLGAGVALNLPWTSFSFFLSRAGQALAEGLQPVSWILLVLSLLVLGGAISISHVIKRVDEGEELALSPVSLSLIGAIAVLVSYTIFGLNDSYGPTFDSLVNRVNAGATVGLAFVFSAFCLWLKLAVGSSGGRFLASLSVTSLPLVLIFVVANWALAKPYILSWQVQSQIVSCVKKQEERLKSASSLLLINVPRYVNESPVFDGVWDFQNMIRLKLGRNDINGGVVGDRFKFFRDRVLDAPGDMVLATYKVDGLYVMISPEGTLIPVRSIDHLLALVEEKGMQFENDKTLPDKWRSQLEASKSGKAGQGENLIENSIIKKTFD